MKDIRLDNVSLGKTCSRTSSIGKRGEQYVQRCFEDTFGWPTLAIPGYDDRGIDFQVTLPRGQKRKDVGIVFHVQVKATGRTIGSSTKSISYRASPDELAVWLGRAAHAPVILVVYSSQLDKAYWTEVLADFLFDRAPDHPTRSSMRALERDSRVTFRVPTNNELLASQRPLGDLVLDIHQELRKQAQLRPETVFGLAPHSVTERHLRQHNVSRLFRMTTPDVPSLTSLLLGERSANTATYLMRVIRGVSHKVADAILGDRRVHEHLVNLLLGAAHEGDYLSLISLITSIGKVQPRLACVIIQRLATAPLPQPIRGTLNGLLTSFVGIQVILNADERVTAKSLRVVDFDPLLRTIVADDFAEVRHHARIGKGVDLRIRSPQLMWDCTCDLDASRSESPGMVELACPTHRSRNGFLISAVVGTPTTVEHDSCSVLSFSGPVWPPSRDTFLFLGALDGFRAARPFDRVKTIIDMGCGTGIVGIYALTRWWPEATVVYCDSSVAALRLARYNHIRAVGDDLQARFVHGYGVDELSRSIPTTERDSTVFLCTPPYLPYPVSTEGQGLQSIAHAGLSGTALLEDALANWQRCARHALISTSSLGLAALEQAGRLRSPGLSIAVEASVPLRLPVVTHRAELIEWLAQECGLIEDPDTPYHYWHKVKVFTSE